MTRRQAETIANAIAARVRRNGALWTVTTIPLADVAGVLKKRPADIETAIADNGAAIWGCLPMGWTIRLNPDSQSITVARRDS